MMEQGCEPFLFVLPRSFAHTIEPRDTFFPFCAGCVSGSMMFSLVRGLPSATSATSVSGSLVRLLRWYYASVRLLAGVPARIMLLAFPDRSVSWWPPDAGEVSRFSRVQFLDVLMALGLRRA